MGNREEFSGFQPRGVVKDGLLYGLLGSLALLILAPLLWLLSTALKSPQENIFAYPPRWIPAQPTLQAFERVWQENPFWRYAFNSLLVAGVTVFTNLWVCSWAAYPLARMTFRGRRLLFWLLIGTSMIPFQITMIPLYVLSVQWGLRNSYLGLILPYAASAFGIFLLRQAFLGVPQELEDAARIDGCSSWGIWWHVMLPAVRPALITLAVFTFVAMWGDFLWPLLLLDDPNLYTLPLGVANLASAFSADWRLIAAGSLLSVVPVLVLFWVLQRYVIPTDLDSGIRG
ncbi:carbohydrate ABC transporter permease [Synechococcus sp. Nb3U1]|uniref:carbohydrate ABC transporter permease n=1 Tax=Synechococcus sp. Nb3U1 TaxID=1914529 RepID=UPI001F434B99|nr:carbohydrate ABC transporter permease [Synechococcus sp. Nb3U1]MCF2969648.1 carbohydrate ABC transporter permease [Synechococcus sp. Nb3U1]